MSVGRRGNDRAPLGHFGLYPGFERSGHCKRARDIPHRRTQGGGVVERAGDDLDAAVGQPSNRRFVGPAHHRAHPGITCQQRVGNRAALPAGGAQDQKWISSGCIHEKSIPARTRSAELVSPHGLRL